MKGGEQDETVTVSTRDMEKPKAYAECNNTEIEISECAAVTMVGTIEVKARYSGKRLEKEAIEQFSGILKKMRGRDEGICRGAVGHGWR